MLQDIKNTLKQSAVYGLSRISLKLVSFILTPVISIYFTVSEYGVLDRFERFWQIIFALALFGVETGILRWYTLTNDKENRKSQVFTIFLFLIGLNLLLLFGGILFSDTISRLIFDIDSYGNIVIFTFLIAGAEALMVLPLTLLRAENKPGRYLFITSASTLIAFTMQLYFLIYSESKLEGIFISKFIAPIIVFIFLIPFLFKHLNIKFSQIYFFDIIRFSFPLMLTGIVSTLLNSVNRFIIGFVGNSEEVGLFGLASNISGILTFVLISPFQLAFNAIFWQKLKDKNAQRFFTKSVTYSFLLYVWGALILSLITPYIIKLYIPTNPSYWAASKLIPILSLSLVFYGMLVVLYMSFHHEKRNDIIFYFQAFALLLNISLNYIFIPYYGMYGAAYSNFLSYLFLVVSMYLVSRKFFFIKFESLKLTVIFVCAVFIISIFQFFELPNKWLDIWLRILLALIFPFLLLFMGIYEKIEIETLKNIVKKYIGSNDR